MRWLVILAVLFAISCEPRPKELSCVHIWCDECQKEIIGTYFTDDGFSFYCSCNINYRSKDWNQKRYMKWNESMYAKDDWSREKRRLEEMQKQYIIVGVKR